MSATALKVIAILAMTFDHIGWVFVPYADAPTLSVALHTVGKLTFPIMAFFVSEGFRKTSSVKRYVLRLLAFALISQIPFYMAFGNALSFDVMFTLALGAVALWVKNCARQDWRAMLILIAAFVASNFCDWGAIGLCMVFFYGSIKHKLARATLPTLLPVAAGVYRWVELSLNNEMASPASLGITLIATVLTCPLLYMYNGKRGKGLKYLFYGYYPAHLLILSLIRFFVQ